MAKEHPGQFSKLGIPRDKIIAEMQEARSKDVGWICGQSWGLVYHAGEEVDEIIEEAFQLFAHGNGLDPKAFPSLKKFETEVVAQTAFLLNGGSEAVGTMTSGGSESLLMTVKSSRDQARQLRPGLTEPEIILPQSAHPALDKAAHYLGVKTVRTPLDSSYRADLDAVREAINDNTIMLVGSAPAYPHGVIDPIDNLGELALEENLNLHVDACLGGYFLPFLEKLGYSIPPFDFRVPGVTSISADLHKYGYSAKGASTIIYRNSELRRYQFFVVTDWPGGLFGSSTVTGTRPGGPIAAAWAVINYLGEEGYKRLVGEVMETTRILREGIEKTGRLKVLGDPAMSILAVASNHIDVFALADVMAEKGWQLGRQQLPPALHLIITPPHSKIRDRFLSDLNESLQRVEESSPDSCEGVATMYAMMGTMCHQPDLKQFAIDYLDKTYRLSGDNKSPEESNQN